VVDKAMHVSPFFGMDQSYRIAYDAPSAALHLSISAHEGDAQVFAAALRLHRRPVSRRTLGRLLWRYPLLTMRVSAAIHTHALRLWRKGATFHTHPSKPGGEVTDARSPHDRGCAEEAA
jgi:hypothetical protein